MARLELIRAGRFRLAEKASLFSHSFAHRPTDFEIDSASEGLSGTDED
jgi:hypothetical protein